MNKTPWIMHVDGDGFFAYCEIARFPHLRGKPVVVGEDRGIVCAMTYEAKKLGITRAMPIFRIREQFPEVVILSSHFELYEQYADKLASLLEDSVDVLERYSIDECFALVHLPKTWTKEMMTAWMHSMKQRIQRSVGLTYSFGLARTKVLAKVASRHGKPDGCTAILASEECAILQKTPVESLWGIGNALSRTMQQQKIDTAYQLRAMPHCAITKSFAQPVQELWHELHGRSMLAVSHLSPAPKSLQSTRSFVPSSMERTFIIAELLQNVDIVFARMRQHGLATAAITFFLKTTDRRYHTQSIILPYYTNNPLAVSKSISECAEKIIQNGVGYKATGATVQGLRPESRIDHDLFGLQVEITDAGKVMQAVDQIRKRYGHFSIGMAASMPSTSDRLQKTKVRDARENFMHGLPLPYLGEVQ